MRFLSFFITFVLVFLSCTVKQKIAQQPNPSLIYRPGSSTIRPEYLVFHLNDTVSQLLVKINTDELLFNQANPENAMQAVVKVYYELIDITKNPENKNFTDSASVFRPIDKVAGKRISIITLSLKAQSGKTYLLKVTTSDVLHNISQQGFVFVNKQNKNTAQNFKLISRQNNAPLFRSFLFPDEAVRIQIIQSNVSKIFVRYQKDDTPLPPPPFSVQVEPKFNFRTDSIWSLNYNPQTAYQFSYQGLYLIQVDSTQSDGVFFSNFGSSFPKTKDIVSMIAPLEYLTTTEEFRNIQKAENKKLAVDNYWLKLTNNVDMARELIRIYYNRLAYANSFFTSYKEGWKTDRGMIYMIFGAPNNITKTATAEIWEYHNKQDVSVISIKFLKIFSPYTENLYVMQRNDSYTPYWRNAVESWHNGKVYNIEE
jgi:GWxTD domain-containing protein